MTSRLLPCLACALVLAACGSNGKLTNENLGRIHNGMTETEVQGLLGKPGRIETGETLGIRGATYYYQKEGADVKIVFLNNGVMVKEGTFK